MMQASPPRRYGSFAYYTRYVIGGQHPLFCRTPRDGEDERVLVDGNALAKPHAYFRIAGVAHSPDHRLIAYAVDTKGSEFYTVNVIEADTGVLLDSRIADNNGSLEWAASARPNAATAPITSLTLTTSATAGTAGTA